MTDATLDTLSEGAKVRGFTAESLYLDDADKPIGARFKHDATGFTVDYLRIETAPQGFIWVNSFPTSDKGEPHTQEHLLLGKGNRGREAKLVVGRRKAQRDMIIYLQAGSLPGILHIPDNFPYHALAL